MSKDLKKTPRHILDPQFRYRPSYDTDVGRHLRAHQRRERDARKAPAQSAVVEPLAQRRRAGGSR